MTPIKLDSKGMAHCVRYGLVQDNTLIAKGTRAAMREMVATLPGRRVVRLLTIHVVKPERKAKRCSH